MEYQALHDLEFSLFDRNWSRNPVPRESILLWAIAAGATEPYRNAVAQAKADIGSAAETAVRSARTVADVVQENPLWVLKAEQAWEEGKQEGWVLLANRLTLGLIPVLRDEAQQLILENGGLYPAADISAQIASDAVFTLAGIGVEKLLGRVALLGSRKFIAPTSSGTVKVYRKMSLAEAEQAIASQELPPRIAGTNSNKYVSESLSKVEKFQNEGVAAGTQEVIVEFELDAAAYAKLRAGSIPQQGSAGSGKIVFNTEGLSGTELRNLGIPESQLGNFNKAVIKAKKVE